MLKKRREEMRDVAAYDDAKAALIPTSSEVGA